MVVAPSLLAELMRARLSSADGRQEVGRLLVQAYRAADAVADKYGHYDLSARIIELMRHSAAETGDALVSAAVAYVRTEVFFANGKLDVGRRLLEQAADSLRLAVTAARAHLPDYARAHLAEAETAARRAPESIYCGTAFGPSSVRIHQVSLSVELGDVAAALTAARSWMPAPTIPAERRSHLYIDVARARVQAGQPDEARAALYAAQTIAPEHTASHPQVKDMLPVLRVKGR